jgi:hypothetical protein
VTQQNAFRLLSLVGALGFGVLCLLAPVLWKAIVFAVFAAVLTLYLGIA